MDSNKLIEAVKLYPGLFRKQQSAETSIDQKNAIWKEISLKLNQPAEKCKAKWRNLRDSYQKSVKYRQELEGIGKLSIYHEYRHEAALSFLEVGSKRKSNDGEKRAKPPKKPRDEYFETRVESSFSETHDYSPAHAVEYLIETDPDNNESRNENDEDEEEQAEMFQVNSGDDEQQIQEISSESAIKNEDQIADTVYTYSTQPDNEVETVTHEEISYQEAFVTEASISTSADLDSWLNSLKQDLLSFPKLLRARAKKKINDVVSDLEIEYLESLEIDRSQIS